MCSEAAATLLMANRTGPADRPAEDEAASIRSLVARALQGDGSAFDRIMLLYQGRVISTAWRMLGDESDARDAAQEVFLRVYKHLGRFDPSLDMGGWLYRITMNVCRDIARKRARSDGLELGGSGLEGRVEQHAAGPDVETAAIVSQQREIIARALDTLSRRERAALVLRDLEGLSTEEVSRILGSSAGTVRSQISSARAKIKRYRDRVLKQG